MVDVADSRDIDLILKKKRQPQAPESILPDTTEIVHGTLDEGALAHLDSLVKQQKTKADALVAQRIEQSRPKGEVRGSIPLKGTHTPQDQKLPEPRWDDVSPGMEQTDPLERVTEKVNWPAREQPVRSEVKAKQNPPVHNPEPVKKKQHVEPDGSTHTHHIMTMGDKMRFVVLRSIGNFLLLFSIYGVVATFGPTLYYEATFRAAQARGIKYTVAEKPSDLQPDPTVQVVSDGTGPSLGSVLSGNTEQILVPPDASFSIVIPKIGASARVFPNVDTGNEEEFLPLLQQGVAHAKGTVFPGLPGNIYLFAHSTDNWWNVGRYNAVFYLLKDLQPGDDIVLFFEGRRHNYVVSQSLIADPSEVSYLTNAQKGEEQLVLQTCWPPGTTWKRYFVFAKPKIANGE